MRDGLNRIEKAVNRFAAVLPRIEGKIGFGDDVGGFVSQPVEPVIGIIQIENVLAGNTALDQLSDALAPQQLHPDVVFRQEPVRQKGEKNEEKIEFHAQPTILHRTHILLISI